MAWTGTIACSYAAGDVMREQPAGGTIVKMSWDHVATSMAGDDPRLFPAVKGGWIETSFAEQADRKFHRSVAEATPPAAGPPAPPRRKPNLPRRRFQSSPSGGTRTLDRRDRGLRRRGRGLSPASIPTTQEERQMQTLQDVQTWRGMTMVDADGDKIGTIDQIFLDRQTGQPEFATVKTGLFGLKTSFVPIVDAEMTGDNTVRVPVQKEQVKDAPRVEPDGQELSPDEERRLWEHYGRSDYDEWHGDDQTTDMDLAEDRPAIVGVRLRRYVVVVPTDRR